MTREIERAKNDPMEGKEQQESVIIIFYTEIVAQTSWNIPWEE